MAMTRAKNDSHLVAPLKYYITQQSRTGSKHLYGARSRFMTDDVLRAFEVTGWPALPVRAADSVPSTAMRVDAAAKLRAMWD